MRKNGILLPISALPSKYGIGCFSKEAYEFVTFLKNAGQEYWQVLPLGPTGYGDSPYQSFSSFAGNPYFIDLEELIEKGYLTAKECDKVDFGSNPDYVDYEKIYLGRFKLLKKAYIKSAIESDKEYKAFVKENSFWLDDYALYMAVKNIIYKGKSLLEWKDDDRLRKPARIKDLLKDEKIAQEAGFWKFTQYMFYTQWFKLKAFANENGVEIIGDIPIYVSMDSADTWANPKLFKLDKSGKPTGVAGCPPDYFSPTGQLWGNPLYDWDYHKKTNFAWWMKRLEYCFKLYDIVRIDHFRGFDEYYNIPYGDPTAEFGHWEQGPGYDLFDTLRKTLGKKPIIAEDLGFLTPSVLKLVKKCGYPGMKILEFAFDGNDDNGYIPHNFDKNCVVYTGTHDNDTVFGWYPTLNKEQKKFVRDYLNVKSAKDVGWGMIRLALMSTADTAIIPFQDYLGLGSEARMNIPSTLGGNWSWRMKPYAYTQALANKISALAAIYGR